MLSENIIISTV